MWFTIRAQFMDSCACSGALDSLIVFDCVLGIMTVLAKGGSYDHSDSPHATKAQDPEASYVFSDWAFEKAVTTN